MFFIKFIWFIRNFVCWKYVNVLKRYVSMLFSNFILFISRRKVKVLYIQLLQSINPAWRVKLLFYFIQYTFCTKGGLKQIISNYVYLLKNYKIKRKPNMYTTITDRVLHCPCKFAYFFRLNVTWNHPVEVFTVICRTWFDLHLWK